MSVPSTSTGPRMYFACLSSEHVTSGLAGSSTTALTDSGFEQSSSVNSSRISGVTQAGSLASVGVAVGVAVPVPVAASVGARRRVGEQGLRDGPVRRRGRVGGGRVRRERRGRRRGRGASGCRYRWSRCPSPSRLPVAAACGEPASAARTGRNRSCEGLRMASSVRGVGRARDRHDDVAAALGGHLGLGHAVGVDALRDDVARLVELALVHLLAGVGEDRLEDHLGAALEVEAELGRPLGRGPGRRRGDAAEEDDHRDQRGPRGCGAGRAYGGSGPRTTSRGRCWVESDGVVGDWLPAP